MPFAILRLRLDPIPALLDWMDPALHYFVRRDLLEETVQPIDSLWKLPVVCSLINKQKPDGSWQYPGKSIDPRNGTNYFILETYRYLRVLVDVYGLTCQHPCITRTAGYIFSCQRRKGDIFGILGKQYMPYYHGAILELLIKAGFEEDPHILKGLDWLLSMRQEDGGWVIPAQQVPARDKTPQFWLSPPIPPDRSKPHAHIATGMALRAFAAHPRYRNLPDVIKAGERLKERIFQPDRYRDRKAASYWLKFQYPFWWTSLITALDTLQMLGFSRRDEDVIRGMDWVLKNQSEDGLWETGYDAGRNVSENRVWIGLSICRLLKAFFKE